MRIFQKGDDIIGLSDKFIYLLEVYTAWSNGSSFDGEYYISLKAPIKITNKMLSTKTKKSETWKRRYITLKFAPEKYLRQHGYREV